MASRIWGDGLHHGVDHEYPCGIGHDTDVSAASLQHVNRPGHRDERDLGRILLGLEIEAETENQDNNGQNISFNGRPPFSDNDLGDSLLFPYT
jgi:hypothetical protein